jgi:Asp-tRNA(Asn)/Glu-tRNA(Gln) amidotransferase A subunit family amidase
MAYVPIPVKAPRLTGRPLRFLAAVLESRFWSKLVAPKLLRELGLHHLRAFRTDAAPTLQPLVDPGAEDRRAAPVSLTDLTAVAETAVARPPSPTGRNSVMDFHRAYREGRTNPSAVAEAVSRAIRESNETLDPPLRAFFASDQTDVQRQAAASTARWQAGRPLSVFDGVPVAVKDELDQPPYRGTGGTRVLSRVPPADAATVARLRAAGALLVGKTTMHEIGIGVTGMNPNTGFTRNPFNLAHASGGSSSGSGAAVSAGIVPLALGADGGGSVRIPAALCGVVGLKATWGRVSERGGMRLCWSVGHVGPIAGTALDCALGYAAIAGADAEADFGSPVLPGYAPPVHLADLHRGRLDGVRLGVYWDWFRHARTPVADACETMVRHLESQGAKVVPVEIPHLEAMRLAHAASIASEQAVAVEALYDSGKNRALAPETRVNLGLARCTTSLDYIRAQRVRTEAINAFRDVLGAVDVIVTPTTACTAPAIQADALAHGESDLAVLSELMRFVVSGNLTGLPAISFPAGSDQNGLPVGLQVIGRWWQEHLLLRLALVAEQAVPPRRAPLFYDVLSGR